MCDLDRRITYWSKSAARITGWQEADVVGRSCFDGVLCHADKDGHELCHSGYCPLHRAMVTGKSSVNSQLVYAHGANGQRVPVEVTVSPICDKSGKVVGGVETFRDASAMVHDLERAKSIQQFAMEKDVSDHIPVSFNVHYLPRDIVGGDYYAIKDLGKGQYGIMLADVMGHGIAAALYTMYLSSFWNRYHPLLKNPVEFASMVNEELTSIIKGETSFATAICGVADLNSNIFRFASAGGPEVVLIHDNGKYDFLKGTGLPLGLIKEAVYEEFSAKVQQGDCLLIFSDGAVEIKNAAGKILGSDGLIEILRNLRYPQVPINMDILGEYLLKYSNSIHLDDDLTIIELRF